MDAPPTSADDFVEYRFVQVADHLQRRFRACLEPAGLSPRQFSVLALLADQPAITAADLARGVLVTPQSMRVLLDHLEDRGLLERRGQRRRGLAAPATLTPAGRRALADAVARVRALDAATRAALGPVDHRALRAILDRLAALPVDAEPTA